MCKARRTPSFRYNFVLHEHAKYFMSFDVDFGCKKIYFIVAAKQYPFISRGFREISDIVKMAPQMLKSLKTSALTNANSSFKRWPNNSYGSSPCVS